MCFDNPFVHTSVAFRRDIVSALGGYDETLPWAQDWELWSRVLRAHDGVNVADRLVTYRSHEHSVTALRDPARHRALAQGLVTKNVEAVCGLRLRDDEAALLAAYGTELAASDLVPFFVLVRQLLRAFAGRYPSAATGGEPARTLAWQIDALAARVLPRSRASVLAVYRAGLAAVPAARQWISWPRAAARVCLGPRGLAHVRRWRRAPGLGWPSA